MTPPHDPNKESRLEGMLSRIQKKLSDVGTSVDKVMDKIVDLSETTDAIYDAVSLKRDPPYHADDFLGAYD